MKNALKWLPLHIDGWLFGSTRNELNAAQRGVFVDLLALSAKDDGYIRANEETPYPLQQLAGLLFLDPELLAETVERCIEVKKITKLENGTLRITNYGKYQLSRQHIWRITQPDKSSATPPPQKRADEEDERRGEHKARQDVSPGDKYVTSSSPSSAESVEQTDGDGLLPIPKDLPFSVKDDLRIERADIKRRQKLLATGKMQDGPNRLSQEILEKQKERFNENVRNFT